MGQVSHDECLPDAEKPIVSRVSSIWGGGGGGGGEAFPPPPQTSNLPPPRDFDIDLIIV